jgi:hypothetical protein
MTDDTLITALAPAPEAFEPEWSQQALAAIRTDDRAPARRRRRGRRLALVGATAGVLTLGTATAVAVGGPEEVVHRLLTQFEEQPNTTGNGLGPLEDPELVALFPTKNGIFAVWVATPTTKDGVCVAYSDGQWDGTGTPRKDELEYGCGGEVLGPDLTPEELTRPDQVGGFFKDDLGPILYGVSPYAEATTVHVQGTGVDRTLPVRADSHGYGSAIPEADEAAAVTLTFLAADGRELGTKRIVAPVG